MARGDSEHNADATRTRRLAASAPSPSTRAAAACPVFELTQDAEAHFAAVVQIRVESYGAAARGAEIDLRRSGRVGGREEDVEEEEAAGVGSALRTADQELRKGQRAVREGKGRLSFFSPSYLSFLHIHSLANSNSHPV